MHSKEKIKKIRERAIIREYINLKIKTLLKEQDDDFGDYGAGGYGGRPGSTEFTLGIFGITGVMNVAKVAFGVGEAIITRVLGEAWLLARRLWYTINPAYFAMSADELENIMARDRASLESRLDRVHAGYADTVREAEGVINRMGGDINAVMFLANPAATIGYMASRGSVGAARNLYHRVTVGGPPPALASRESSLSSRAAVLEREHLQMQEELRRRGENSENVMNDFARELLGPNATVEDLRNFITSNRGGSAAAAAPAAGTALTEQRAPSTTPVTYGSVSPTYPAMAVAPTVARAPAATPRAITAAPTRSSIAVAPSTQSTTDRINDLRRRTQELKRDYISFLNSSELQNAVVNEPVVQEGQKVLTDMIVQNYENTIKNVTFDKMRDQHEDQFEQIEKENPAIFDTEEKRNAFTEYARQQLTVPAITQLDTLARENPTLREEVADAKRRIQTLAQQGTR